MNKRTLDSLFASTLIFDPAEKTTLLTMKANLQLYFITLKL